MLIDRALPAVFGAGGGRRDGMNGVYVCGDWTRDPSINGAMESGGLAAAAVLKDLGVAATV